MRETNDAWEAKQHHLPGGVVWMASRPKFSFQSLANAPHYGEIKYIFTKWNRWNLFLENWDRQIRMVHHMLKNFDPERDFFVPIGDVTTAVVCVAYLTHLCRGRFMMLIWNPQAKEYEPLEVDVGDYDDEDDGEDGGEGDDTAEGVRTGRHPGRAG